MEPLFVALSIIGVILILVIIILVHRYLKSNRAGRALILYNVADNYSELESEVKFESSKNDKIWIGQSGLGSIIEKQQRDLLREQYEAYAAAMKVAKNWCNLSNLQTEYERKMADELPCIGHRQFSKFFHPMFDEKYGSQRITNKKVDSKRLLLLHYDTDQLPLVIPSHDPSEDSKPPPSEIPRCRLVDFHDDEQFRAFRLLFETLQHPYLMRSYQVTRSKDKRHLFIIRDLEKGGSLRDHIYCSDLSAAYGEKYCRRGKPLYVDRIRKYCRQILEAMYYLNRCGVGHFHLHSGNVIIQNDTAKLAEIENQFFGLNLRHPLHQHLEAVKKVYYDLDDELCLFGYLLFEMATGYECPTPSPLDCLHEIPRKQQLDRNITSLLGRIFGDKSMGNVPTIGDLLDDPFFNAINVPRCDVSGFLALKQENDTVLRLVEEAKRQSLDRYSAETLLGDGAVRRGQTANTPKKKKKKKRRKRDQNEESHSSKSRNVEHSVHGSVPEESQRGQAAGDMDEPKVISQKEREEDSADDLWSSM